MVDSELNRQRIGEVENCFGSAGRPLSAPGRVLMGEGILTKMCRRGPQPKKFFLFNDVLVYGAIVLNKKLYVRQRVLPLAGVTVEAVEDDGDLRNGWMIRTAGKSFRVFASTAAEKTEWMSHVARRAEELRSAAAGVGGAGGAGAGPAAAWVPDYKADACMRCRRSRFTPINRRHHCRKCGLVVCGGCSTRRLALPLLSPQPLRVCDACFQGHLDGDGDGDGDDGHGGAGGGRGGGGPGAAVASPGSRASVPCPPGGAVSPPSSGSNGGGGGTGGGAGGAGGGGRAGKGASYGGYGDLDDSSSDEENGYR